MLLLQKDGSWKLIGGTNDQILSTIPVEVPLPDAWTYLREFMGNDILRKIVIDHVGLLMLVWDDSVYFRKQVMGVNIV